MVYRSLGCVLCSHAMIGHCEYFCWNGANFLLLDRQPSGLGANLRRYSVIITGEFLILTSLISHACMEHCARVGQQVEFQ